MPWCIPVGSQVAGIPLVIDNLGVVFSSRDKESLQAAITQAQTLTIERKIVSDSIIARFSPSARAEKLKLILEAL